MRIPAIRFTLTQGSSPRRVLWLGVTALATGLVLYLQQGPSGATVGSVVPVSGRVTVDDEPLEEGTVTFIPDPQKGNTSRFFPTGKVQMGSYELSTQGKRGAPPGWYKVIVIPQTLWVGRPPPAPFERRFSHPDRTPLAVEVVSSVGQGIYDLRLHAP